MIVQRGVVGWILICVVGCADLPGRTYDAETGALGSAITFRESIEGKGSWEISSARHRQSLDFESKLNIKIDKGKLAELANGETPVLVLRSAEEEKRLAETRKLLDLAASINARSAKVVNAAHAMHERERNDSPFEPAEVEQLRSEIRTEAKLRDRFHDLIYAAAEREASLEFDKDSNEWLDRVDELADRFFEQHGQPVLLNVELFSKLVAKELKSATEAAKKDSESASTAGSGRLRLRAHLYRGPEQKRISVHVENYDSIQNDRGDKPNRINLLTSKELARLKQNYELGSSAATLIRDVSARKSASKQDLRTLKAGLKSDWNEFGETLTALPREAEQALRDLLAELDRPIPPEEHQPAEPQPAEPQPDEPQPAEPQPAEPQPDEPQPDEPQPDEHQPDEPQPAEPQPAEPQPDEPQPAEPQRADSEKVSPRATLEKQVNSLRGLLRKLNDFATVLDRRESPNEMLEGLGASRALDILDQLARDPGKLIRKVERLLASIGKLRATQDTPLAAAIASSKNILKRLAEGIRKFQPVFLTVKAIQSALFAAPLATEKLMAVDPRVFEVPLAKVQPGSVDLSGTPADRGDTLVITADLFLPSSKEGAEPDVSQTWTSVIERFGLSNTVSAQLTFVKRSGRGNPGDRAVDFAPSPSAAWTLHYRMREEPDGDFLAKAWNFFDLGIGISAAALSFEDSNFEIGIGAQVTLFGDLLQAGYGYNLNVKRDHGYFFVGIGVLEALGGVGNLFGGQNVNLSTGAAD